MCLVMDAVGGKKARHSDFFWADSDFLTESFRLSFPGEWQVCIGEGEGEGEI